MPINKNAYFRYRTIDRCLNNPRKPFPSLEELAEQCSEELGLNISTSTIEKDLRAMKQKRPAGFSAPIVYNHEYKGYAYGVFGFSINEINLNDDEWEGLKYAARLLFQYAEVPLFRHFKAAIEKIDTCFSLRLDPNDKVYDRFVQFETANDYSGYEWIATIYECIRKRNLIRVEYENVYKQEIKSYNIHPCLLKEHRNKWYLIGWVEERKDYLTFALDRIRQIENTGLKQPIRQDFNADLFLQHTIGIMEQEGVPQKVRMKILGPYQQLVKRSPIHHSQIIIKETKEALDIELSVFINEELCNHILSMGRYCKVTQPASLKKTLQSVIAEMSQLYR